MNCKNKTNFEGLFHRQKIERVVFLRAIKGLLFNSSNFLYVVNFFALSFRKPQHVCEHKLC